MCKRCQNIFVGLKKTCLGVLKRETRDKDNETDLKEGGVIEMLTTVLHSRAAPSLKYSRVLFEICLNDLTILLHYVVFQKILE